MCLLYVYMNFDTKKSCRKKCIHFTSHSRAKNGKMVAGLSQRLKSTFFVIFSSLRSTFVVVLLKKKNQKTPEANCCFPKLHFFRISSHVLCFLYFSTKTILLRFIHQLNMVIWKVTNGQNHLCQVAELLARVIKPGMFFLDP